MRSIVNIMIISMIFLLYSIAIHVQAQTTWYVDCGSSCPGTGTQGDPFCTIQQGIDAAYDGDTVLVLDGTCTGDGNRDLNFGGKAITMISENGPDNCIIDCQGTEVDPHRGFYFHREEGSDSILSGLTIINGYAPPYPFSWRPCGGAIYTGDSSPTITCCCIPYSN